MKSQPSFVDSPGGMKIVEIELDTVHQTSRIAGERLVIEAEISTPSALIISAAIKIRPESSPRWTEVPMQFLNGNRWHGEFFITEPGSYIYVIEAWVDQFKAWRRSLQKELQNGPNFTPETLQAGAHLIDGMVGQASALDSERLVGWATELRTGASATGSPLNERALDESLAKLMTELAGRHPARQSILTPEKELRVVPGTANRRNP